MLPLPLLLALSQAPDPPVRVYSGRDHQTSVAIPRLAETVQIDGRLDEPVWAEAAVLDGFSQYRPVDGRPAEDSTQILIFYQPDALVVGIRAFEPHGAVVRATLADRDNIDADDQIQLLLDTFHDHRHALLFAVNPLGVQEDGVRSEGQDAGAAGGGGGPTGRFDGIVDLSPDFVFQSRGHVTPWGYEIEVRIPFKSIRYQSADPQSWGFQVVREVQHSGYEDTWTPVVRANASFLIQEGALTGLTGMHRGLVMDMTPEFTTRVDGAPGASRYVYTTDPEVGGTVRWGITQNLALAGTANPDFSQVEADVAQVTLNQRFALFYPEKRPFFLEGLEQFDTPNRLIYTRQIVAPVAGAKLTGKVGSTNVAVLSAVDQTDAATGDHPVFNVARLQRDFGASSTGGLVYTDRIEGADYNRVLGADARVIWRKIWFSSAQIVGSWTRDGSGSRDGMIWDVTFGDRTGRNYGNHFELVGVSPNFRAASGFVNRTGIVTGRFFNRVTTYGAPGAFVEQVSAFLLISPIWRYSEFGRLAGAIEGGPGVTLTATLRGGWNLNANASDNIQRFDAAPYAGYRVDRGTDTVAFVPHSLYRLWAGGFGVSTPNRALGATLNVSFGQTPIFAEAGRGHGVSVTASAVWKPTASLRVEGSVTHVSLDRSRDGTRFSTGDIPRLKIEYQLTRDIFFRYVGQYVSQRQAALTDPATGFPLVTYDSAGAQYVPAAGSDQNDFRNDVLFSYKPTPGTVLFVGYGASLVEPDPFRFRDLSRTSDGFFLKLSYLFRM